jgi:cytochrome c2
MAFQGCFRCHDDNHKATSGKTIAQDCESCHSMQ